MVTTPLCIGIPKDLNEAALNAKITFSHDPEKDSKCRINILRWLKNLEGFLILHGEPGRGKSLSSVICMHYLHNKLHIPWHEMRFINISDLYQEWIMAMDDRVEMHHKSYVLRDVKVLVLDDMGVKKPTEAFLDYIYYIINERGNDRKKMTIITTNLSGKAFSDILGPRLVSRVGSGVTIQFDCEDHRLKRKQLEPIGA